MTAAVVRRFGGADPALVGIAGVLTAALLGLALAVDVRMGMVLLAAAVYVPIVLLDPPLGIALWVALSFFDSLGSVGLGLSAGTVLIGLAAIGTIRRDEGRQLAGRGVLLMPFALLVTWFAVTLAWADDPAAATSKLLDWLMTGVIVAAVTITVRTARDVRVVLGGLVVGPAISVIVGLANDGFTGAPETIDTTTSVGGRLVGGVGDPNFLAISIVPAIVLAAVLRRARPLVRWGLVAVVAVLVVGLLATQSRGGLVAGAAACVAALVFMTGQRLKVLLLAATVVAVGVVYLAANSAPLDRITGGKDEGGTGRTELWEIAVRVASDHPVIGVGLDNFTVHSPLYTDRPGLLRFADLIAEKPHVVHNTYLETWVESGLVGLVLFALLVVTCLRAVWSAGRIFDRRGSPELALLSRALLLATVAVLVGGFFLSFSYRPGLWLFLTLCVVLLAMARDADRPLGPGPG